MIDILVGLAIGGAAGAVTSAPFAVSYIKGSLSSKKDVIKSVLTAEKQNLQSFANLSNVKVQCVGVEDSTSDNGDAMIVLEFITLPSGVGQIGIGIVGAQAEWVHPNNDSKKKTTTLTLKDRIFLLERDVSRKIKIPVPQEGNFELASVQLNVYEGGVSKTHKVRLAVQSQIFSASDI